MANENQRIKAVIAACEATEPSNTEYTYDEWISDAIQQEVDIADAYAAIDALSDKQFAALLAAHATGFDEAVLGEWFNIAVDAMGDLDTHLYALLELIGEDYFSDL